MTPALPPNSRLLELSQRGNDIQKELPYVHAMLASDRMDRRTNGWAAFTSAFPELVAHTPGYNSIDPTASCVANSQPLLEQDDESPWQEHGATRNVIHPKPEFDD